jgi:hypothetical protein
MTNLTFKIDAGTTIDNDQLEEMTVELVRELSEFDDLSVSRLKSGDAEAGTKTFENIAFDTVMVDFAIQFAASALPMVIATIWNKLRKQSQETGEVIKVEIINPGGPAVVLSSDMETEAEAVAVVEKAKVLT